MIDEISPSKNRMKVYIQPDHRLGQTRAIHELDTMESILEEGFIPFGYWYNKKDFPAFKKHQMLPQIFSKYWWYEDRGTSFFLHTNKKYSQS